MWFLETYGDADFCTWPIAMARCSRLHRTNVLNDGTTTLYQTCVVVLHIAGRRLVSAAMHELLPIRGCVPDCSVNLAINE